ncbi:MAG TPA: M28 family peptidase [Bryobacteraceae bacterium]|nr:M28 family peptidase [Bryobacteraceae bacterium]
MKKVILSALVVSAPFMAQTQNEKPRPSAQIPAPALYKLEDALLDWPLAPQNKAYGAIDGKRLHEYVSDLAAISRRYRDQGHPQFWGRIIGTSADAETAQWVLDKFHQFGMTDVHIQPFDLPPQWMPQSWEITGTGGGKTLNLDSAQPAYQTKSTTGPGLDLEAVYVGTGSEADFAGRDVRGKAVFIFSMPLPGSWRHTATAEGALRRAEAKGAAAIFAIIALPGNIRTQLYPTGTNVPTFSLGMDDGYAIRDLIGQAGQAPHVKVRLEVNMEPGLRTGTVWGTLPGMTEETIYILAHRDGWFESSTDNGSGVATMVGLAEYFSKIPKEKRRRTIVFAGTSGHHNGGNFSGTWLLDHRDELFAKTALMINCEHTATGQTYLLGEDIRMANMYTGMLWYAGGPRRPKLQEIAVKAFHDAGVVTYATPERAAPGGEMSRLWPYVPGVQASDYNVFFHSDHESPDTVPWTGLQAATRAYAMIIDGVNKLDLTDLQRPAEAPPTRGAQ